MNFIAKNYLRVLPLIVAGVVWLVGYIYIHEIIPLGLCSLKNFDCTPLVTHIGHPARQFAYWLIPTSLIVFFSPYRFLKRWLIFASIYLLITWISIANSNEGGGFNNSIEFVAWIFGIGLLAITILWLLIYAFFAWRRSKSTVTSQNQNIIHP